MLQLQIRTDMVDIGAGELLTLLGNAPKLTSLNVIVNETPSALTSKSVCVHKSCGQDEDCAAAYCSDYNIAQPRL